jgi:hypothetical protein
MLHRCVAVVSLGLVGLLGCGAGGVRYSGQSQARVLAPAGVASVDQAPAGQRRLGQVSAECRRLAAGERWERVRLSELSCSNAFLLAALKQAAARAGGTFLVQPGCDARTADVAASGGRLACAAEVWGPAVAAKLDAAPAPLPLPVNVDPRAPAAPGAPELDVVGEAWDVFVEYAPVPGRPERPPSDPALVGEVDFPRVGQVRFGDLRAECDTDCSVSSLRTALVAGAASLGATTLVDVRCVDARGSRSCVASAAGPQVNDQPLAEVP